MVVEQAARPRNEVVTRVSRRGEARSNRNGAWVFAGGLQPVETSTVVDHTGDSPVVTDGPYSDSKISLGGFWVIEAADLDAAQTWAQRASRACLGKVEVRPFQDEPED